MKMPPCNKTITMLPGRQGGYALILGLMLILVMSVFGVFAMSGSILQERMAGNENDFKRAFESGEMALRWGEAWLQSRTPATRPFPCQTIDASGVQNCTDPRQVLEVNLLDHDLADRNPWDPGDDNWANARAYGDDPAVSGPSDLGSVPVVYRQPVFVMEQAYIDRDDLAGNPNQGRVYYRIVAAATGARESTRAVVESKVAKRYE